MKKWFLNLEKEKKGFFLTCLLSFAILLLFLTIRLSLDNYPVLAIVISLFFCFIFSILFVIFLVVYIIDYKEKEKKARILQEAAKRLKSKQSAEMGKSQDLNTNSSPAKIANKKPTIEELRLAKSLSRINKIIDDFLILEGDKTLNKILEKFYENNKDISFEYYSAPMKENDYSEVKPNYKFSDLSHIDPERLKKIIFSMTIVYNSYANDKDRFKNVYFGHYVNHFFSIDYRMRHTSAKEKIKGLYQDLITNGIFSIKTEEQSFFTYMNEFYRKQRFRNFNRLSMEYGIKKNSSYDDAIQTLIEKNIGEKEKEFYIALKKLKEDNSKCFYECILDSKLCINKYYEKKHRHIYLDILTDEPDELISNNLTINDVDMMNGFEFEKFIADIFSKMGFTTTVTKSSNDQGIDVIAKKNGITIAIQAKCYTGVVGNHAIMEAFAGMTYYNADRCLVVTNSKFTKSAKDLAKRNGVELWDRNKLIDVIGDL